jgi:hypothetical protein
MLLAEFTVFLDFELVGLRLLVPGLGVVPSLAGRTRQGYYLSHFDLFLFLSSCITVQGSTLDP